MADIRTYPLVRHLRAEPTAHVLRFRKGHLVQEGAGAAFWFRPIDTAVAEVPVDDRELPFLFHVRTADFQEVTVQGAITFRVTDAARLARRVDFAIDLDEGFWPHAPLEQVGGLLTQLAQQFVIDALARDDLRTVLAAGVAPIRERITAGLRAEQALQDLGLEVVAVRVAAVRPTAEMEKALQQPTREAIQQGADQATFQRRAQAVEKERAIAENELANRLELARRQEELVGQEGANERRRAEEQAAAQGVEARGTDERVRLAAQREADTTREVGEATLQIERERAQIQGAMAPEVLLALALRELAGQLGQIDHLTVTPDLLAPLLARVTANPGAASDGKGA
ncbi:MAG: SPFH domain-containing protein [Actinomycetota bacterium]|nr:SPFH domain-containing protein [Actinomycetota bacterium]